MSEDDPYPRRLVALDAGWEDRVVAILGLLLLLGLLAIVLMLGGLALEIGWP